MITLDGKDQSAVYADIIDIKGKLLNNEIWFGKRSDQSGDSWAEEFGMTPYQIISGNNDWGADPGDEAKIIGANDTPARIGKIAYDIYRIIIVGITNDTPYYIRLVYGLTTLAEAVTALQYTSIVAMYDSSNPTVNPGIPLNLTVPKLNIGVKVWAQCKNATDNASIEMFVGIHEYNPV